MPSQQLFKETAPTLLPQAMLNNVRIRDTRRLAPKKEGSGVGSKKLRPKKGGVSPFSQLALANGRVLEPSSP